MRSKVVMTIVFVLSLTLLATGKDSNVLMLATTTSADSTGLLDALAVELKKDKGIDLRWTAVGTGKALQLARDCNADVVLVHDPDSEAKFMAEGYGINRSELMYNDFIIIGPKNDPAGIKGKNAAQAFKLIATKKVFFASRADKSGTHVLELKLWKQAGLSVPEREQWYIETGQGMLQTIAIAEEKSGYTLTDRATYIKYEHNMKNNPSLVILSEKDKAYFNQYSAIEVNPDKCPNVNNKKAREFIKWMASPKIQKFIGDYKINGKKLFVPNAK